MKIVLDADGPLDPAATLARYHVWGDDPANRVTADAFRRVLRLGDRPDAALWPYEVRWRGPVDDAHLLVTVPGARSAIVVDAVTAEVRRIFGLDFDLPAFYRFAKTDPVLAELVGPLVGLRPTLAPTGLEMLVGLITAQQVNLAFAFACRARLVRRYGTPVAIAGETVYAFPAAAALARVRISDLRAMKFSTRKAEYIRDVAGAIDAGTLDLDALRAAPNARVVEVVTALRGLGRWTAEWYLARCLGRGDVCPAGDLGVRRAFERYFGRGRSLSEEAVRRRARAWGEHRNVAIHYLLTGMRLGLIGADRSVWTRS
jgi:DNA-3-methyladenine glycosylase II